MQYYNKIAKGYNELYEQEQLKKLAIIKKYLKPTKKDILLDIGAGTGISTKAFNKVCKCIALEPAVEMLKQYSGEKILGTAESIPFKAQTFSIIISITSFHHFNINKALKEIKRVSKPNAKIIISILKSSKKAPVLKKKLKKLNYKIIEEAHDLIFFSPNIISN